MSNDNWIKIYSIHERSVFRSHNVANFNLSSLDCVQIWKTGESVGNNGISGIPGEDEETNDELNGSSVESSSSGSVGGGGGRKASSASQK